MPKRRYIAPPDAESWERQTGETADAFAAFATYRDMGADRSLAKVAHRLGKTKTLMDRWSAQWQWVGRAADHDADVDRRLREEDVAELQKMRGRHLAMAQAMQRVAQYPIMRLLEKVNAGTDPGLSPTEAMKLLENGIRLERLFRGEPDLIQDHQVSVGERRKAVRLLLQDPDAGSTIDKLARRLLEVGGE